MNKNFTLQIKYRVKIIILEMNVIMNWKLLENEVYLYDGTFNGLLTIAFDCYISKLVPSQIVPELEYETNLLEQCSYILTDEEKAKRIWNGLYQNVSYQVLYDCYNAFLSCAPQKEIAILKYILNGFCIGGKISNLLSLDYVVEVMKLRKNVLHEAHRLKGLVRLQELENNLWYASIHPNNNVIENVGQFLIKRFPTQNLILHDKNRNLAFLYQACSNKNYEIVPVPASVNLPNLSAQEKQFQSLWKTFFHAIAIKERINPRLQMQYMPKKYWQDLVEKK